MHLRCAAVSVRLVVHMTCAKCRVVCRTHSIHHMTHSELALTCMMANCKRPLVSHHDDFTLFRTMSSSRPCHLPDHVIFQTMSSSRPCHLPDHGNSPKPTQAADYCSHKHADYCSHKHADYCTHADGLCDSRSSSEYDHAIKGAVFTFF
jgi:hypothetical protein